jgi:methionyl-tRNA formyltransferase
VSKVRVCFLGTPEFAVTSLKQLVNDEHFEVVGVVTQPDRPSGRKMQLTPSPVKAFALSYGLKVISPEKVSQDVILQEIEKWGAEVAVVVAFGQILSQKFLDLFRFGAVNVHGSLLPRWRGAAPIQRAIEAGDTESGVTLQKIVKKLDAGDIIGVRKIAIGPEMTATELFEEMAFQGADLLHIELMDYVRGNLAPTPQDESQVEERFLYAKKIEKSEAQIDWSQAAEQIHNKVRGFHAGPGTFTTLDGKKIKIHKTRVDSSKAIPPAAGTVTAISDEALSVATGRGILNLLELQPESRNRMSVKDFLKGHALKEGDRLGT